MTLAPIDRTAVSVVSMLENAKQWLASAVETTGPAEIAAAKAHIVTAETYARELGLSKEIQQDAQEMVRRAEYSLGKSIRKGQAEGTVRTKLDGGYQAHRRVLAANNSEYSDKPGPTDFASADELSGNGAGIYAMTDGVEPEVFAQALDAARAEGNLSRANVVRKVKGQAALESRDDRADLIATLAGEGYSIRQMPAKVGIGEQAIRNILRDYDIDVPAERSVGRTRRHDSTRIASQTVTALEGLVMGVELIDYDDLDAAQASQWADSLNHTMTALKRFHQEIRKATQ